jgi:ribosomal protein L24
VQVEQPIDISNCLPVNPKTSKGTRVRFKIESDSVKKRVAVDGTELGFVVKKKG